MRLKKIEVVGFKSFADRQLVVVDEHVTGVIGPNGCGKSNIVDAIRWCMGEQSAKHLRGTGMSDVIFAGCSSRGPAGMAEVTITFLNQGEIAIPHFNLPEIAITRRLYADGTSEYMINKVPARLRDISELLMGTGAGTKGYSIIEQGQVGRIVSSKPEERRHIIDEAAGITRFKAQKAAAQRKIEATRQNLDRVSDVVNELEVRLGTLRRQAQKAERYKKYREELRDLDLWTASHKYLELTATGAVLRQRHAELSLEVQDLVAALQARETHAEVQRKQATAVEEELAVRQQKVYDLEHRIQLLDTEQEYRRREREALLQSGAQAAAEAEAATRTLEQLEAELAEVQRQREGLSNQGAEGQDQSIAELEHALRELERSQVDGRRFLETSRREQAELGTRIARADTQRQNHEDALRDGQARLEVLRRECSTLERQAAEALAAAASAAAEVEAATARLEALRSERGELDRKRSTLRQQVSAAEVALDTKRAEVHRHRSRLQSLEEIQSRYRSCHSGVQVVMQRQNELATVVSSDGSTSTTSTPGPVYGVLADYLQAPELLETALSAALGDRLEGVVVDAPAVGARGVELLKREQEGRTTFVPRRSRPKAREDVHVTLTEGKVLGWSAPKGGQEPTGVGSPFEVLDLSQAPVETYDPDEDDDGAGDLLEQPGVLGRLGDLVEVSADLGPLRDTLLGDVVVVDSLRRALELWEERRIEATLVTLDGDRIEPSGVVVGGSPTALNSALLQQKREIRELQEILRQLDEDFAAARARHQGLAEELHAVESARERSEIDVLEAEKALVGARGERDRAQLEAKRLDQELAQRQTTADALQRELEERRVEIKKIDLQLAEERGRVERLEVEQAESTRRLEALGTERDALAQSVTEAKVALARWQQQTDAIASAHERLSRQIDGERQRIARLQETATTAGHREQELEEAMTAAVAQRAVWAEESQVAAAEVAESKQQFEVLRAELDELDHSMRTIRSDLDGLRQKLARAELGLQESNLESEHLLHDTQARFEIDVREVLIDYHGRAMAGEVEIARQKELKTILARMGEVNLTAIEEFEEVSKRYEYLSAQRKDLDQAIDQLQEAIDRINKTTRDLFKQTFDAVNEKFQQLFPRLFGGGHARLKMTDPNDLLGTGVEIEAKPPGKQPRTLDLLSGGEKALTAVSLIFAIFLIKPSPFCLLDEVDAPLDDANVARFCGLVRELSAQTQFIIITHNKVSMETADRLYGVTMEQRGVSKLVSVNLRRAVEMAYN